LAYKRPPPLALTTHPVNLLIGSTILNDWSGTSDVNPTAIRRPHQIAGIRATFHHREDCVVYLISYDSERQTDSTKLTAYLNRHFTVCARILPSQHLVHSEATALAILLDLRKHIHTDAGLLISEITQNLAWHNLKIDETAMEDWEARARDCS
jgi:hypothetical protein